MKKHIFIIISLIFIMLAFSSKADDSSLEYDSNNDSYIFDRQQSDIESIFDSANSSNTIIPELQNSLPAPSFRLISSQKKTQQNLINSILLKRFSSEVQPTTEKYNNKFSFPLSSKEDLIVIVRHLII